MFDSAALVLEEIEPEDNTRTDVFWERVLFASIRPRTSSQLFQMEL
jgi:hypothetical protein